MARIRRKEERRNKHTSTQNLGIYEVVFNNRNYRYIALHRVCDTNVNPNGILEVCQVDGIGDCFFALPLREVISSSTSVVWEQVNKENNPFQYGWIKTNYIAYNGVDDPERRLPSIPPEVEPLQFLGKWSIFEIWLLNEDQMLAMNTNSPIKDIIYITNTHYGSLCGKALAAGYQMGYKFLKRFYEYEHPQT